MAIYSGIEIGNFRGIASGAVRDLAPLSVLVGPNNSGKSTILEALWIGMQQSDVMRVVDVIHARGWCGSECALQLFHDGRSHAEIVTWRDGAKGTVEVRITHGTVDIIERVNMEDGFRPVLKISTPSASVLVDENGVPGLPSTGRVPSDGAFLRVGTINDFGTVEDAYSDAVEAGHESRINALLPSLGLDARRLRILKRGQHFVLHTVGDESRGIPVYFSGDGFKRLLLIACILAGQQGNLVLLEEPEAFQNPTYLDQLTALIWKAVESGTQVVLSTHSLDLLRSLLVADSRDLTKAALFRTSLSDGTLHVARIDGTRAKERLDELHEDLRL